MSWRAFNRGDIDDGFQMPKRWGKLGSSNPPPARRSLLAQARPVNVHQDPR